jgi:hypothetical protein
MTILVIQQAFRLAGIAFAMAVVLMIAVACGA